MDLVVGASESTVKSLLGKLGSLLAQEYTLIRGVTGDLQYINDELASMQSFLRDLGESGNGRGHGHDHRMKDWMKQIRDLTYDIEDCVDDSGHRIRGLDSNMCCYFLVNSVYEIVTWWPRRDIATKISNLKMRAQQICERRQRYGVDNPKTGDGNTAVAGFDAAANQDRSLQLVATADPVGVNEMEKLETWVTNEANKFGVMYIVGFGGVGKTSIATALYQKFGDKFDHRAMVTVSQSSDIDTILTSIKTQVMPKSNSHEQLGTSEDNRLAAAIKGMQDQIRRGKLAVKSKCRCLGTSEDTEGGTKRDELSNKLREHFQQNSYLILIDDVWSAATWDQIRKSFPPTDKHNKPGRVIVTTRFQAVAATRRGDVCDFHHKVVSLPPEESKKLFEQALSESKASKNLEVPSKNLGVPNIVWQICRGLPLAIVAVAGYVACNADKKENDWMNVCSSLFPERQRLEDLSGGASIAAPSRPHHSSASAEVSNDIRKDLTQEELGRIVSYCYNDMPAEIKTCSLYLSIFPKGSRISRKRLTRRWIAEGFVSEKQGMSVEDVAETYFSHLVRRKIIRPVEHSSSGKVKKCSVHDMVLEHIVSKASEENFITVIGGHWLLQPPSSKVRRLSLQHSDPKRAKDTEKMNLSHVRSLTMFGSLNQLPSHSLKFGIVQVLDLEGCKGFKEHHIREICEMHHLKYLSLRGTDTKNLSRIIGKLENLETLDIRETKIAKLPKDVCNLERLVHILGGDKETRNALKLPEEFVKKKKMKALRILSGIEIVGGSADLHHLTDLRKLAIYRLSLTGDDASIKNLSSSIEYLCGYYLHTLVIDDESLRFFKCLDEMTSPPKFLTSLELSGKMVKLPGWITQLDVLTKLTLSVTALREDNLTQLSKLKALFSLTFMLAAGKKDPETLGILTENKLYSGGGIIVPAGGFGSLKLLRFVAPLLPLLNFSKDAMPELERLELRFNMLEGIIGAENLTGLKEVYLRLKDKNGEIMTMKAVDEMKSAVSAANKGPRIILDH